MQHGGGARIRRERLLVWSKAHCICDNLFLVLDVSKDLAEVLLDHCLDLSLCVFPVLYEFLDQLDHVLDLIVQLFLEVKEGQETFICVLHAQSCQNQV